MTTSTEPYLMPRTASRISRSTGCVIALIGSSGLRCAFAIHDFGRERGDLAEVDEVFSHCRLFGQRLQVGDGRLHVRQSNALKERRRTFVVAAVLLIQRDQS